MLDQLFFLDWLDEESLLLDEEEGDLLFLDFPLCFFTFLRNSTFTFSSSRSRRKKRKMIKSATGFFFYAY
jgi:hypothetical protein